MATKQIKSMAGVADQAGLYAMAGFLVFKKVSNAAIEGYKSLFSIDKEMQQDYYRSKGIAHAKRRKYTQAIPMLEKALKNDPQDVETIFYLGVSCLKTGDREKGSKLLEKGIDIEPDNAKIASALGMAYIQAKEYKKAAEMLEKALGKSGDNFDLYYRLGMAYDNLKEYPKAIMF